MPKEIFVHVDLEEKTHFVGRLFVHERHGRESVSFEYSSQWRSSLVCFPLEPALILGAGAYHTDKALFGSIGDSAPDRWGRTLMNRLEARRAILENRAARMLKESDYLLMVDDRTRQGALRFSTEKTGLFLASYRDTCIPPLIQLVKLLNASSRIITHEELDQDLRDLVEPGSSLGGARPKAVVLDTNSNLLIAKFPSPKDEWDVELWEFLSLRMAKKAGIPVPGFRLVQVLEKNVLLLNRFDRTKNNLRVPFLSAMSMLGASDGETRTYLEIADAIQAYGANATQDLADLWRRIVFNVMVSNVDDHLRNHGFLYQGISGWRLSPIYDLEPTPEHVKARILRTNIDFNNPTASLDLAFSVADFFGLKPAQARKIAKKVGEAVKNWDKEAARLGAGRQEIEFMRSAFDHGDLRKALADKTIVAFDVCSGICGE
ncbi:MAG: HipA domain-containing protein [Thermodesulfobacteriota bacterium]|nr:HipA domain-containing protein [Thermodesulfobacteriota bacterium]